MVTLSALVLLFWIGYSLRLVEKYKHDNNLLGRVVLVSVFVFIIGGFALVSSIMA